ncbi:MlaD family protein [Pokkaliibacter sp. CJK22405]|uniref:PqiB family protein n=1 Tax=Pokkaliibacter sp. CJK22405 TaxID=3384615 RepID=UPI00398515D6
MNDNSGDNKPVVSSGERSSSASAPKPNVAQAVKVKKRRSWSFIWLLPFIAVCIGVWLLWHSMADAGIDVTITFKNGQGLEAGKTEIRYKGLKVGMVKKVQIGKDLETVIVEAELDRSTEDALKTGTQFWLVTPHISLEGVTGLDTLVSGNYIGIQPGNGAPTREFVAATKAPPVASDEPGLHLTLKAKTLGSLSPGAPIYYKQIKVGSVQDYRLADNSENVEIDAYVEQPYDELISEQTRFWNASGVTVSGGLNGFKVRTESLVSLISGGIAFANQGEVGAPVANGHTFQLYNDYASAETGIGVNIHFNSAQGLVEGVTKVIYRGVEIGTVQKMELNDDYSQVNARVLFDPKAEEFLKTGTRFWLVKPSISLSGLSGLDTLVKGNYIAVEPGKGDSARDFTALGQPPAVDDEEPGLKLTLDAKELGSVSPGTPLYYQHVEVGSVVKYNLKSDGKGVTIVVNVRPRYIHLVNTETRFWHASGVRIKGGLGGVSIETESVMSLISGGIAMGNVTGQKGRAVKGNEHFILYSSMTKAAEQGREVHVHWQRADGLKAGDDVKWNGLTVGEVREIKPLRDFSGVDVTLFLHQDGQGLAREGAEFWVVHPEATISGVSGLDTVFGGSYVAVRQIDDAASLQTTFIGRNQAPAIEAIKGMPLVLEAHSLGSIKPGVNVYYRGVAVGQVSATRLADTADRVLIDVLIQPRYGALVRTNSVFWNNSGFGFDFGLFKGASLRTESLESLVAGGISFATPPEGAMGGRAKAYSHFKLNDDAKDDWSEWAPRIQLPPEGSHAP